MDVALLFAFCLFFTDSPSCFLLIILHSRVFVFVYLFRRCSKDYRITTELSSLVRITFIPLQLEYRTSHHLWYPFALSPLCYGCIICYIYLHWKHSIRWYIFLTFNSLTYFKECKMGENWHCIYPDICQFCYFSFLYDIPSFFLVSFAFFQKNFP